MAQFEGTTDKEANRHTASRLITQAANDGATLIVLPESAMFTDFGPSPDPVANAEPLDGAFVQSLARSAETHGVWVVAGMTEALPDGTRVHNTVVAVSPGGALTALYRKVHLYDSYGSRESDTVAPGDIVAPTIFDAAGFTIGVMTCYDLRFPESARRLADAGAQVIVVPSAWAAGPLKEDHWATLVRARAIENTCYVVASGQTGPNCTGNSMVVDPQGVVISNAGTAPGVASAELLNERLDAVRAIAPFLDHRRFAVTERLPD
ncbi:carbon-nitrogen hydrolase family protein [Leifsonia sp. RAF41]|uniref:carbon-nitrogen hydrolase family protein n=1 Tax=Leifsonia sp. RAF41 TaxID=3233056 RepID=UPI003F98EEF5